MIKQMHIGQFNSKFYLLLNCLCVLLFVSFSFTSCELKEKQMDIYMNNHIDSVRLNRYFNHSLVSNIVIGEDTIPCIFDSGCIRSLFPINKIKSKRSGHFVKPRNIYGYEVEAEEIYIDTIKIGNTMICSKIPFYGSIYDNCLIGLDILSNFVLKSDNKSIFFSQDTNAYADLYDSSVSVPFDYENGTIWINGFVDWNLYRFIFDTGYPDFICIRDNSAIRRSIIETPKDTFVWKSLKPTDSLNIASYIYKEGFIEKTQLTHTFTIGNFVTDKILLKDEIIRHNEYNHFSNYIGNDFCRRFEYFIVDFSRRRIYFGPTREKSFSYMQSLYKYINSLGIYCTNISNTFIISDISKEISDKGFNVGDTIIAINNIPVCEMPELYANSETIEDLLVLNKKSLESRMFFYDDTMNITVNSIHNQRLSLSLKRKHIISEPNNTTYITQ